MSLGEIIRATRKEKSITLRKLAKDIGVSPSFISQVEQNKAAPSVDSLTRIARVLGVNTSYLLDETDAPFSAAPLKNRFDPAKLRKVTVKRLAPPDSADNNLEPALLVLEPDAGSDDMSGKGEEFLLMLSGQLDIKINGDVYTIREGDNIYFNSSAVHSFANTSGQPVKILWVKG
ncbi:MAG: XRE family transcriptional regulator [Candidatus Margulisbacteria bacterium]|jgi:transcriptional regulator with XRE-family HTH domain|nr:XRE family transcriptional regulator [Candidatus Margulisiibacteriota bacterium]